MYFFCIAVSHIHKLIVCILEQNDLRVKITWDFHVSYEYDAIKKCVNVYSIECVTEPLSENQALKIIFYPQKRIQIAENLAIHFVFNFRFFG